MRHRKKNTETVIIVLCLLLCSMVFAMPEPNVMEITTSQSTIKIGEPLIITVTSKFNEPQISPKTKQIMNRPKIEFVLSLKTDDMDEPKRVAPLAPMASKRVDPNGLEYSTQFMLFYDYAAAIGKKIVLDESGRYSVEDVEEVAEQPYGFPMIFNKPGGYSIQADVAYTVISNELKITVEPPTESEQRAISLLDAHPLNYALLRSSDYSEEMRKRIPDFEKLISECGDTFLGKWAAAQLGIAEYEQTYNKHYYKNMDAKKAAARIEMEKYGKRQKTYYPEFDFRAKYRKGQLKEPAFERAHMYLQKALELPDYFPVRKRVLEDLMDIELLKGNDAAALSYADEVRRKYPNSRLAKRVSVKNIQSRIAEAEEKFKVFEEAEQQKIEDMVKFLEELWLEDESIRETLDPNQWREFIEAVKNQ